MALLALEHLVLVFEHPARLFVVEAFFAAFDGTPTHHVETASLVLEVAVRTGLPLHLGRGVVALARANLLAQVLVVVTVQTLVGVDRFAVCDVAEIAALFVVDSGVLFGQIARAGRKEVRALPRCHRHGKAHHHEHR